MTRVIALGLALLAGAAWAQTEATAPENEFRRGPRRPGAGPTAPPPPAPPHRLRPPLPPSQTRPGAGREYNRVSLYGARRWGSGSGA